jgi:hypothetical protein
MRALDTLPATVPQQLDLGALAAAVRAAHLAVNHAARNVIEHASTAGDALHRAKAALPHGRWLPWLKQKCDLSERQAQRYMAIAAARETLTANPLRVGFEPARGASPDQGASARAPGSATVQAKVDCHQEGRCHVTPGRHRMVDCCQARRPHTFS